MNASIECYVSDYPIVSTMLSRYEIKYARSMVLRKYYFSIEDQDNVMLSACLESIQKKVFMPIKIKTS